MLFIILDKMDIKKGGEGAPLSPIFHKLIASKLKFNYLHVF